MQNLTPCPGCARHIQVDEARCPFCRAALAAPAAPIAARPWPGARLGRAALLAYGSVAVAASGCDSDDGDGPSPGTPDSGARSDGGLDGGSSDAGALMRDATVVQRGDASAVVPVTPDAGDDDLGGIVPIYALAAAPWRHPRPLDAGAQTQATAPQSEATRKPR
jgi:hypothetical protein